MTRFVCPHCRGGFDLPGGDDDDPQCPWCGTAVDGRYDPEEHSPIISTVRTTDDAERNKPEPLLQKLKRVFT